MKPFEVSRNFHNLVEEVHKARAENDIEDSEINIPVDGNRILDI